MERLNYCKILTNGLQSDQRKPQSDETQLFEVENIWKFASHSLSLSIYIFCMNKLTQELKCLFYLSRYHTNRKMDRQSDRQTERQKSRKTTKERKRDSLKIFLILFSRFHSISCSYPIGAQACVRKKELSRKTNLSFFGFFEIKFEESNLFRSKFWILYSPNLTQPNLT